MNKKINAATRNAFLAATKNQNTSSILSLGDLSAPDSTGLILHFGTVGSLDTSVSPPANSISVETSNGTRTSRCFCDKLEKAGLSEGDSFLASFVEKNGYANVAKIMPQG
jgi:hypothetical protein